MQNVSLSPAMKRVCPAVALPFVGHAPAMPTAGQPDSNYRHRVQARAAGSALPNDVHDAAFTVFLASGFARLAPVLGLLLALWGSIAWSAGWLGALGG